MWVMILSHEGGCEENMRITMYVDTILLVIHVLKSVIDLTSTAHTLYIRNEEALLDR